MKLLQQGAEAKIYLTTSPQARQSRNKPTSQFKIIKQRTKKSYRHPQLDNQIRTRRTKSETKILTKALSVGANVPKVLNQAYKPTSATKSQQAHKPFAIELEYIAGDKLSETLNSYPEDKQFQIMQQLGKQVALLHKNNIIHGDITTSNVILQLPTANCQLPTTQSKIFLIDFGLSYVSTKIEDKAVDLHLIKQALEAKHFQNHQALFEQFLKTYKDKNVINRLKTVEKRGRYKH